MRYGYCPAEQMYRPVQVEYRLVRSCLSPASGAASAFEQKLKAAAPLMYRSLLDLVRIMEETSRDCGKCGPELWNYAQEARANLLDELIRSELAEAGIKGGCD